MTDALFELIRAHCIRCEHSESGTDPQAVHDAMEAHYTAKHRAWIDAVVADYWTGAQ